MKNFFYKVKRKISDIIDFRYRSRSFSQTGEDLIINFALTEIGEQNVTYLNIGANHPCSISNTYYFYNKGLSGTIIEPDPILYKKLKKKRPRDNILNFGVGFGKEIETTKLYIMSNSALNTFSLVEAKRIEETTSFKIVNDFDIELVPINLVLEEMKFIPSFISIDVESLDYEILESLDTGKYRPAIIVAETLTFEPNTGEKKTEKIIELMLKKKYMVYADTRLNTVFIDQNRV